MGGDMEGNIGRQFYREYYQNYFGTQGLITEDKKTQQKAARKKNSKIVEHKDISLNKKIHVEGAIRLPLKTVYPGLHTGGGYTFGAGLEGEFQMGFLFDHTTGLPYLPGSSVKGAIRSVFPNYDVKSKHTKNQTERVDFIWNEYLDKMHKNCFTPNFSKDADRKTVVAEIELEIFDGRNIALEKKQQNGANAVNEKYLSIYQRDIFYDAYIAKTVENGQPKGKFLGTDYITPHRSATQNPTPLPFLKILPGVTIDFQFQLHDGYYLTRKGKKLLFKQILIDFGIGAKTNVGYGQLAP
jgi:CRISPR-associated protein Cmr6